MKTFHFLSKQNLKSLKAAELSQYITWLQQEKTKNQQRAKDCQKQVTGLNELLSQKNESKKRSGERQQIEIIRKSLKNN